MRQFLTGEQFTKIEKDQVNRDRLQTYISYVSLFQYKRPFSII